MNSLSSPPPVSSPGLAEMAGMGSPIGITCAIKREKYLQGAKIYSLTCTGCTNWICVLGSELAGHCNKEK